MNTRTHIVETMIALAARDGYAGASTARLAGEAGLSRSTFHAHFAGREDCFAAAQAHVAQRVTAAAAEALIGAAEPTAALVRALFGFAASDPDAAQLLFCESLAAGEAARRRRDGLVASLAGELDRRWQREAAQPRGPDLPASTFVGVVFRVLATTLRRESRDLATVRAGILAWADSYAPESGRYRWRTRTRPLLDGDSPAPHVPHALARIERPGATRGQSAHVIERGRIVEAIAIAAYWHDLAKASVGEIASAARIPRTAFYRQFSHLEAAALDAFELSFELALGNALGPFFAEGAWRERIWTTSLAASAHGHEHPSLVYLAYVEPHAVSPRRFETVRQRILVTTLLFEEGYHAGARAAKLPRIISEILAMAVFELAYREAPRRGAARLPVLLAQRAYVMLAPFVGPEEASDFVAARLGHGGGIED